MIPILYDKKETVFISNGLGRLRDCISCIVTEERNGIYECDFEYPTSGANYNLIQVGRIIGVTHDDTGDVQPFDIVGFEKPIDGVVTFHCTHISYRMSYLTVTGSNINSLSAAFTLFGNATPTNPFTYTTDKTSTGYLGCANGTPRTVRQMLGGIEGSVLDAYGGEYEWDKWTVKLWSARGQVRDFTIRYGVNMLDYNEEYDASGCYSSCIPYWTDGTTTVVGDKQTNSSRPPTGRDQCIPLDVSDKFENQPTKAQVNATGLSTMNGQNPTIPAQSIEVSFVRLQDMGEYTMYQNLLQCSLCDTINVVFPDFNSGGQFKIVKTEWNVLEGKYESMELGDLSVSLSEALGISNTLDSNERHDNGVLGGVLPTGTDLNDVMELGTYLLSGNNTYVNSPTTYGILEVRGYSTSTTSLRTQRITMSGRMYTRYYSNGWLAWATHPSISMTSIANGSSVNINIPTSTRGMLFIASYATASTAIYAVGANASAKTAATKIAGGTSSNITVTAGSTNNIVKITNNAGVAANAFLLST